MRRTIFAAVPLAVLALAAPVAAKGPHATTYKGKVSAVGGADVRGQAKMVDGKRDKVQVHVKGLEPGAAYTWSVRSAADDGDACSGEAVDAFEYGALTARRHGQTKARSRSREFSAEDGTNYAVVVTDADGNDVACGELLSKADRRAAEREAKEAHGKGKHAEQGDDDAQGGETEQSDDGAEGGEPEVEPGDD